MIRRLLARRLPVRRPLVRRLPVRRLLVLGAALAVPLAGGIVGAGSAAAHPFGPPPVADLRADGRVLEVRWTAAADDVLALGYGAGVITDRPASLDQQEGTPFGGGSSLAPADAAAIADSPEVAAHLLDRVAARQDGADCRGEVRTARDLVEDGAVLAFTCPEPVRRVDVELALLTDLHPAYRTVAVSADGQRALYTADDAVETWAFGSPVGGGSMAVVGGAGALVAAAGAGIVAWRRRRGAPPGPRGTPAA